MSAIARGDVVQVVKDCCGKYVGMIFTVGHVSFLGCGHELRCNLCLRAATNLFIVNNRDWVDGATIRSYPRDWVKKIEPPAESIEEINRLFLPKVEEENY